MDRDVPAVRVRKSSRHFVVFTSKRALVVGLVAGMLAVGVPYVSAPRTMSPPRTIPSSSSTASTVPTRSTAPAARWG